MLLYKMNKLVVVVVEVAAV